MRKRYLTLTAILLALAVPAGAKTLVCDPQPGVTYYTVTGDPFFPATVPAQPDGSIAVIVDTIPAGSHTIQVAACNEIWGCSTTVPFTFARPAGPAKLRVIP